MDKWVSLTSRLDRTKVWVNLAAATVIAPDVGGSRLSVQGREKDLFVAETPDQVLSLLNVKPRAEKLG